MPVACGIDFGTSNSSVTLARRGGIEPVDIDPMAAIPGTSPTLLWYSDDGDTLFGGAAIEEYIQRGMQGRLLQAVKKHLASPHFEGTVIGGRFRSVEQLVGGYLAYLRSRAELAAGEPVDRVLLGRPARFHAEEARDQLAQRRLEKAAKLAGFRRVEFQLEPIAAARSFERGLDRDVLCLVGDFGGGTCDFSLMRLSPERAGLRDRSGDVLAVGGVPVGGTDFDARLMMKKVIPSFGHGSWYRPMLKRVPLPSALHLAICRWHTLCLASTDKNLELLDSWLRSSEDKRGLGWLRELLDQSYGFMLFRAVEQNKVDLSAAEEAVLRFEQGTIHIAEPVTRPEFVEAIQDEVKSFHRCIDKLLLDAKVEADDVSVVFLTGGSSRVPVVRAIFEARFPGRIVAQEEFTSIGQGLGIEAGERLLDD
jgi:hypothetical chaperone protein